MRRTVLLACLILVPALALAGCVSEPSTDLRLRQGDLARAEIVLTNAGIQLPPDANTSDVRDLCEVDVVEQPEEGCPASRRAYVLAGQRPARLPEGWTGVRPLPAPVVEVLSGLREGETTVERGFKAFGERDPDLVEEHDREATLSRFVDDAEAYGRTWNVTELDNGTLRIEPDRSEDVPQIEDPTWCNPRFCLFESRLAGWNETHLQIRHLAQQGDQVHVEELGTWLTVTEAGPDTFRVDGNDPRAGELFDLYAHVEDIRGPAEGTRRAPGFTLATVDGSQIALEELLGRPVVLEFFATWCPSCAKNAEHLGRVQERFGDDVNIVSIDVDPWEKPAAIRSFMRQHDVTWPVALDQQGHVSQDYHVGTLSTEVIVSPSGTIVHVETGVADHERVVSILEGLIADQAADETDGGAASQEGAP